MTNASIRIAIAGAAFYLAAGATAEAAKGVKKAVPANSQRTISGVVLSVAHTNGSALLHVRTARHHKKRGVVNAATVGGGNQQIYHHAFNLTAATRIEHRNGTPASFAALHRGERVRVRALGQQAVNVHVLSQYRTRGYFTRHRGRTYQPVQIHQASRVQQSNTMQQANNIQKANATQKVNAARKANAAHQPNTQKLVQHQNHRRR